VSPAEGDLVRVGALAVLLAAVLVTSGCSLFSDTGHGVAPSRAAATVVTSAPDTRLTVIADEDPVASAVSVSRALFDEAAAVVVAREGDRPGTLLGSSAAVALGVPLLIEPRAGTATTTVAAELRRLGAAEVLAVGSAAGDTANSPAAGRHDVVRVPADLGAVEAVTGVRLRQAAPVPADGDAAAVAALDPAAPAALRPEGPTPTTSSERAHPKLPRVTRADPLASTVVLAAGSSESLAGIATARAAGARVQVTGGGTDPRASESVVRAVSSPGVRAVVALGAGFGHDDGLGWKLTTAETGTQLPGGGQLLFPGRLLVALYGHPGVPSLGVLGEQGLDASIERARKHAVSYERLVRGPVVPAFEIIATVASGSAGPDGNYSNESEPAALRPWVEAAGRAGLYVLLDLQPGRTDLLTQARRYESLLTLPYVGLALDPEWRLGPGQLPLQQIGSVGIDEVNRVIGWLADLTRARALPQKLLVLHQFQLRMITGRERLDLSRDELAVTLHADGQGTQGDKQATWRALHENAPRGLHWGWKNFYDEDHPMLTGPQTMASVRPTPNLISYQ
jgi:hypothetical protein